jgi:hypothetical protein
MKFNLPLAATLAALVLSAAAQAQSSPPAWSPSVFYKIGDEVAYEGVDFKCLVNETTTHPTPHSLAWGINYVYSGVLDIPVGPSETIETIRQAWTYISGARVADNSSIVIKLDSNYTETFTSSFSLDHPFGGKISIVGHNIDAVATFTGKTAGFTLDTGFHFADLEGFEMVGPSGGTAGNAAIQVSQNSCLAQLKNMSIQNFDIGLWADRGGLIDNVANISLAQFVQGGFLATNGATINVTAPITIDGSYTSGSIPSFGFYASKAIVNCSLCSANNCHFNFQADTGGKMDASGSLSTNGSGNFIGYYATTQGYLDCGSAQVTGGFYGFNCASGAFIQAGNSTAKNIGSFGYTAATGGIINALQYVGTPTYNVSVNQGSYIYGLTD